MSIFDVVLSAVAVAATVINIGWTVWFQRRGRAERLRHWQNERAAADYRFRIEGAVIELRSSTLFDSNREEWAVVEVINVGRRSCLVREIALAVSPTGPTYTVYDRDTAPQERYGPPLPYQLDGGRAAEWAVNADYIRSRDARDGTLEIRLDSGERYHAKVSVNPERMP